MGRPEGKTRSADRARLHLHEFRDDPESYHGIGDLLRAERLRRGEDLETVAGKLRLRPEQLRAIEDGDFDRLPGKTYAAGFVRSYASYLGLDPKASVERFRRETQGEPASTTLYFPEPAKEARVPGRWTIALALGILGVLYTGWYFGSTRDEAVRESGLSVPERVALFPGDGSDTEKATGGTTEEGDVPSSAAGAASDSASDTESVVQPDERTDVLPERSAADAVTGVPVGREAAEGISAPPAQTGRVATAESHGLEAGPSTRPADRFGELTAGLADRHQHTPPLGTLPSAAPNQTTTLAAMMTPTPQGQAVSLVALRAFGETWVQVEGDDGAILLSRILQAGEEYTVPDRPGLSLTTGNAGALEIVVNGESSGRLGPDGAVRRDIRLDQMRQR